MKKWGEAISHDKVYDQIKYEMKIKSFISKHKEEIVVPKQAFITFENEETYEHACDLMKESSEDWKLELSVLKL